MWVTYEDYKKATEGKKTFFNLDLQSLMEALYHEKELLVGIGHKELFFAWMEVCSELKEECLADVEFNEYVYQKLPSVPKDTLDVLIELFELNSK